MPYIIFSSTKPFDEKPCYLHETDITDELYSCLNVTAMFRRKFKIGDSISQVTSKLKTIGWTCVQQTGNEVTRMWTFSKDEPLKENLMDQRMLNSTDGNIVSQEDSSVSQTVTPTHKSQECNEYQPSESTSEPENTPPQLGKSKKYTPVPKRKMAVKRQTPQLKIRTAPKRSKASHKK